MAKNRRRRKYQAARRLCQRVAPTRRSRGNFGSSTNCYRNHRAGASPAKFVGGGPCRVPFAEKLTLNFVSKLLPIILDKVPVLI